MLAAFTVELILYHIVENFEKEEDEMVIGGSSKEKPGRGERLGQMKQLGTGHLRQRLQIRRDYKARE